jgi:hypothetical protein
MLDHGSFSWLRERNGGRRIKRTSASGYLHRRTVTGATSRYGIPPRRIAKYRWKRSNSSMPKYHRTERLGSKFEIRNVSKWTDTSTAGYRSVPTSKKDKKCRRTK